MSDPYCPEHCEVELVECCSRCLRRRRYGLILFSLAVIAFIVFLPLGDPAQRCTYDANKNNLSLRFTCAVYKFMTRVSQATIEFIGQICQILTKFFEQLFERPEQKPTDTYDATNVNTGLQSNETKPIKSVKLINEPPAANTNVDPNRPVTANVEPYKPTAINTEPSKAPANTPSVPEKGLDNAPKTFGVDNAPKILRVDNAPKTLSEEWSSMALKTDPEIGNDKAPTGIPEKRSKKALKPGKGSDKTLKSSKGSDKTLKSSKASDKTLKSSKASDNTLKLSKDSDKTVRSGKGSDKTLKPGKTDNGPNNAAPGNGPSAYQFCLKCPPKPCVPGCPNKMKMDMNK